MELPSTHIQSDHKQDAVLITAVYQVNDENGYELEEPLELANDLLNKLHELGFYIAESGKSVGFEQG